MDPLDPYTTGKSPPPSAPSVYDQPPATGIPVPQHNYNYVDNHSHPPSQLFEQLASRPPRQPSQPPPPPPALHASPPLRQPSSVVTRGKWSTSLCACCSDMSTCCVTCWCPCVTFGQIAEIVDQGSTSCGACGALYVLIGLTGCSCLYSCFYRSKMRRQYMLPEKPCADCCVHFCCECCALCQEHRELKRRGFDMSIGWQGNMERQNPGITMAPNFQGGMSR